MQVWTQSQGFQCLPRINQAPNQSLCIGWGTPVPTNPFQNFPSPLYQPQVIPWWAYQGNMYYPNLHYPGPWQYPGIQSQYYPGQGQVYAAKPNVYVDSIHKEAKFNFKFVSSSRPHFLATTPVLEKDLSWKGKIIGKDKFELDGIFYDYLFYDLRLPKEKMQFTHGGCANREEAIEFMLQDLKAMNYSAIALQDFEEHWRVKIPDYPYYCVYPQYNRELDSAIPVEIEVSQSSFIRSLYILVPYKTAPDVAEPGEIPLPVSRPEELRPDTKIQREVMFREWGVAFLGY